MCMKMITTLEDEQAINRTTDFDFNKLFEELTIEFLQGNNIRDVLFLLLTSSQEIKTTPK